ncbi:Putative glycerophosphodiester phosphodiesterase YhdW (Glycerophosphoryl diester phosphodiesterase) [Durusdinium trenchii]|uniref:Glycerophosphodiester phosphodiesterase YhdW (Glycerophosphoryl diester phosphodiesterase) n=1 Tax=Durusdinium trenchii TaxID=1381693 RepID=A0ABP0MKE5_9DINO
MAKPQRPLVWAHRGASQIRPENTLAAFRAALEAGADGVELDVHPSADDYVVVIHDATVDRTTDASGLVKDLTWAQLQRADAGVKHSLAFAHERVPLLEEVLELITTHDKMLLIELKGPFSGLPTWTARALKPWVHQSAYPQLPRLVAKVLEPYAGQVRAGQILAQSFYRPYLDELRHLVPDLRLLYLTLSPASGWLQREDLQGVPLDFYGVSVRHAAVTPHSVNGLHERQGKVFAWTVDSEEHLKAVISAGVDGVITNRPDKALAVLSLSNTNSQRPAKRRRCCCARAKIA